MSSDNDKIDAIIERMTQQANGEKLCVMCGQQIDRIKQAGRSVYAHGVNSRLCIMAQDWCRQYQGQVPKELRDIEVKR